MAGRTPLENYQYVQTQVDVASITNLATAKASIDELAKLVGKLAAVVGVQARDL